MLYASITIAASVYSYQMIVLSCTLLDAFVNCLALLFINLLDEQASTTQFSLPLARKHKHVRQN